jgi:hypothetical protein
MTQIEDINKSPSTFSSNLCFIRHSIFLKPVGLHFLFFSTKPCLVHVCIGSISEIHSRLNRVSHSF